MKAVVSGKSVFYKGVLRYVWEELKTMNLQKLKSLWKIIVGYVSMKLQKFRHQRQITNKSHVSTQHSRLTH